MAASSEVLFTRFYDAVVRSKDDPPAQVFLLGSDSEPIRAEKSLYELATWTRSHQELAASLLALPPQQFLNQAATSDDPVWHEWHTRFEAHLAALRAHGLQPRLHESGTSRSSRCRCWRRCGSS